MQQDTSIDIYLQKVYPNLAHRQAVVLHYLRNAGGAHTNREIKAPGGRQSEHQKEFQANLEPAGGRYILAHSIDDVMKALS